MRERGEVVRAALGNGLNWTYRDLELSKTDVTILLDALFEYARVERTVHPRLAARADAIRKTLIKRDIAYAEVTAWSVATPALPSEST